MPIKRPPLINNEIYHLVLRGASDSLIFKDIDDYYRGIFSIYEFNNMKPVSIKDRRIARVRFKKSRGQSSGHATDIEVDRRENFVDILTFCFMPNHIHLLVKQLVDNGITDFMRKTGTGYATFFNKKYDRMGHLFQGRFKAVHIKTTEQLQTVFVYIHTNPISLIEPNWKENGIENPEKVIEFLEKYKWSSYSDYIGIKNFPSVTDRDFLLEIMGGEAGCKEFVQNWVRYKGEIKYFKEVELE